LQAKPPRGGKTTERRQDHQEEAKLWPLHPSSRHGESPLHVKWRNQEGPRATSHPRPDGLGRRGQVLFYFMRPLWWDNYRTTSKAPSSGLEAETDTKIIKTETSLHLNLEVFFFLFFILFYFILFLYKYFFFHLLIFYFYSYLYSFYFLFSILSLSF
jgi:hypothetical protein